VFNGTSKSYHLYALKRAWAEMEVTWTSWAPGNPWELPGARGGAGPQYGLRGHAHRCGRNGRRRALNDAGVAALQSWIKDPSTNHGFLIMGPEATDVLQVYSRDATPPERRPRLQIVPAKK
jgi:hypothetical protein